MTTPAKEPLTLDTFHVPVDLLPEHSAWAAIDVGNSTTKLLYLTADAFLHPPQANLREFHCVLFNTTDITEAVEWFQEHAHLERESGKVLHLTGARASSWREYVSSQLSIEVQCLDKMICQTKGIHLLLRYLPTEELLYPKETVEDYGDYDLPTVFETLKSQAALAATLDTTANKFPCIFASLDATCTLWKVDEEAKSKLIGVVPYGGRTLLGLGKAILATSDYNEICEAARHGDRRKVDTQLFEIIPSIPGESEESTGVAHSYGNMPSDLPCFPFGKLGKPSQTLDNFQRADLASALVSAIAMNAAGFATLACGVAQVQQLYFGGNVIRSSVVRREIQLMLLTFANPLLKVYFIKSSFCAAFGALITSAKEEREMLSRMRAAYNQV